MALLTQNKKIISDYLKLYNGRSENLSFWLQNDYNVIAASSKNKEKYKMGGNKKKKT